VPGDSLRGVPAQNKVDSDSLSQKIEKNHLPFINMKAFKINTCYNFYFKHKIKAEHSQLLNVIHSGISKIKT
jgi:hypothetical protein